MGILYEEFNFNQVISDLSKACLTEEQCGSCVKKDCIIGYAQQCITKCLKDGSTYVEDGSENIPISDLKLYNTEELERGIAHILRQCKSCTYNHFDNCIINIIRNCYEVGLMGEIQPYEGSNFRYLNHVHNTHPEVADNIIEEFHNSNN